jgi:thiol-disulfide isomerase/thioredoxin
MQARMSKTLSTMLPLGTPCPPFNLPEPAADGRPVERAQFAGKPLVVIFMCNHCPFVKHLSPSLAEFSRAAQAQGCGVVGINSNDFGAYPEDAPDKMALEVKRAGYSFPYLVDADGAVGRAFGAACTPDFYLFDAAHRLVYRGRYDGSRPHNEVPVTGDDLRQALNALLANQPIDPEQHPSMGCNIKWRT